MSQFSDFLNMKSLRARTKKFRHLKSTLGIFGAACYFIQQALQILYPARKAYRLFSKDCGVWMLCRPYSSDLEVFRQVFVEKEYHNLLGLEDVDFIVDCGANVGYTSALLLTHYKTAHLVAVEPDPENFAVLEANLRSFASRVTLLRAGIWPRRAKLKLSDTPYRDGQHWARQVIEVSDQETGDCEAIDIPGILNDSKRAVIDVLKMDIEGAEAVVFKESCEWLDHVRYLAIELHDDSCFGNATQVFNEVIHSKPFEISSCGETTLCRRL